MNSPLVLSLIRLIPTILLFIGVAVGLGNLINIANKGKRVLGTEGSLPYTRTLTIEERIRELKDLYEKVKSEQIQKEIEKLLGL